ncbi:juvenile hormone esterase-like isoform X1 [Neodiprion virginianus]|uniref:juvenile hormone esterase-like isoform X1 n=1 Tax=Neodiprion virginianus TaxID=2961670 RepID=UPI001EE6B2C0|nr:juvenile hormone esterase-like isoform X1 [Neodiprion virginianus]
MASYSGAECLFLSLLLSIFFASSDGYLGGTTQPEVTIPQGTLQGKIMTTTHGRKISAFLGIPYAQPPVKNKRFANPVPADGWEGIRNATADGNFCPQISSRDYITSVGDEDCLNLNVFTPQMSGGKNSSLLPVMVYVFGGRFMIGSANSSVYGPQYLLNQDVVLVTFNYRLGALGFLSTGDKVASGNWGLKDQVLALEWVQRNIRYFHGDRDRVTLFGHSSGSACVHLLTLSKLTIGLFHKFIMQSGSSLTLSVYRPRAVYAKHAFQLGDYVGCFNDTSDSLVNCLRNKSVLDITAVYARFYVWHHEPFITWASTDEPDIKGAFITTSPANIVRAGQIRDVPCIMGLVENEGVGTTIGFYEKEGWLEDFMENFDHLLPIYLYWSYQPDSGAAWVKAAKSYYFNNIETMNRSELLTNLTLLVGDALFTYPMYSSLLYQHAVAVNPQYLYDFRYRGTWSNTYVYGNTLKDYGVTHADELVYIFPYADHNIMLALNKTASKTDIQMREIMVQLWTSFATHGKPSTLYFRGNTTWEPYSEEDNFLRIGDRSEITLEVEHSVSRERMQFWANLERNTSEAETIVSIH